MYKDPDSVILKLKDLIVEESKKQGCRRALLQSDIINPLNTDNIEILNIECTWGQLWEAMELAEKELE